MRSIPRATFQATCTTLLLAAAIPLAGFGAQTVLAQSLNLMETAAGAAERVTTSEYIQQAVMGDMFEIEASQMAVEKADARVVKSFAQMMVKDHTNSSRMLSDALSKSQAGVTPPTELDGEHKAKIALLRNAHGVEFDQMYVDQQAAAHQQALALHQSYAQNGDNAELKAVAMKIAPVVQEHMEKVRELQGVGKKL